MKMKTIKATIGFISSGEAQGEPRLTVGMFLWSFLGKYKLLCGTPKKHKHGLLALGTEQKMHNYALCEALPKLISATDRQIVLAQV